MMAAETCITPAVYDDLQRAARAVAQRHLNRLVAQAKHAEVRASSRLVEGSPVHDRIVRTAKAIRADVIVMGTHGRTGVTRGVPGSVASRVIATAACPVLTVRRGNDPMADLWRDFTERRTARTGRSANHSRGRAVAALHVLYRRGRVAMTVAPRGSGSDGIQPGSPPHATRSLPTLQRGGRLAVSGSGFCP